ncbi:MAG: iron-containing alcohol dehydrogenase [Deltaproteobacteria bacterium]|jgi:alcohol dehydrogenase class IV|nr:iron-containing alcohol dehydrogenase [Deltaproteobacteria bacterium]MBT4637570.1 iron-containing alcohol dehydrogenase [Deltaproteobacteria bacterium]MBT6501627.1 iron-containing alcohol dehydrogenase [Deltaproteobacteria bacterium]MBT7714346.1 iron-containing alcohol dehydrogenase [Deltaproteobacteria bacterium]MBT7887619.1 iron-containing alcohol dehydrogenase [Deltaproteobacteria bacterium]
MGYWFEDPGIKGLLPLATASGIRGLSGGFNTPMILMGPNVFPTGSSLGSTTIDRLSNRCSTKRVFIISDPFAQKFAAKVVAYMATGGFTSEVWAKVEPEAPVDNVRVCAEAMTAFEPDLIMAVGGGSVMDAAKGAWIMYERPDLIDLMNYNPLSPLNLRQKAIFAAVPTTAGTGSECTGAAVLHDHEFDRKIPISSGELVPDFAILNPEFTMSMPPKLTAGTGLDVLAHAMDSIMAVGAGEMTDGMGLGAIKYTFKYLPRAYVNGRDREARHRMLIGASMAGIAFGHAGAALTHSFGHTLGSIFNIHHGVAVGIFIPYALQYYSRTTDRYTKIAKALDIQGQNDAESLSNIVNKVRSFFKELDIPLNLKDLGISEDTMQKDMERMVLYTLEDIDTIFSPRPMSAKECEKIWNYAYHGKDIDF